jgi:copper oxidase (laccase) domain-containing protein
MSDIFAAVGPGLQEECFEVRQDVYQLFSKKYLRRHQEIDKRYLNLRYFIKDQILESGIPEAQLELNEMCTKCRADLFYSYRRDGQMSGRMMGMIGVTAGTNT